MTAAADARSPQSVLTRSRLRVLAVTVAFVLSLAVPGAPLAVGLGFAATWWRESSRARVVLLAVGVALCVLQAGVLDWPWQNGSGVIGSEPQPTSGP